MDAASQTETVRAMLNIARAHGDYDRSLAPVMYEQAASLGVDANRLKLLADRWLENVNWDRPDVDYQDPKFRYSGSEDLNVWGAMGAVGVIFLEGNPAEDRYFVALRAKLESMVAENEDLGDYLSGAMDGAWDRESALLNPEFLEIAFVRFKTIERMWMSAREYLLTAKLLKSALDCLNRCEFTVTSIRNNKELYARYLRLAAWFIDSAMMNIVSNASRLAANDPEWTEYKDFLVKWLEKDRELISSGG